MSSPYRSAVFDQPFDADLDREDPFAEPGPLSPVEAGPGGPDLYGFDDDQALQPAPAADGGASLRFTPPDPAAAERAAPPPVGGSAMPVPVARPDPSGAPYAPPPAQALTQGFNPVGDLMADAASALAQVSVPRITIHIFSERRDTLAVAERAAQDRRMARATTQVRVGGLQAAIDTYRHEPTPSLVIVESRMPAPELIAHLDDLAENCDAGTKVVVIGATNDIMLYRELMRRGVSEYLVAPLHPLQLIGAIAGLFSDPAQPFVGRSIAFVGARGGSGASTIAHNTAFALSEKIGANTVIVDYDLPFGTAGLDFNQDPINGVADALTQPDRLDPTLLDRMMVRCTDRLSLFAAPATLDTDWDIGTEAFEEVTQRIRSTAPFVVLDLPHLWSGWMRKTLITADEVVVVATPDLASLRNAKNMLDLVRQARPHDAPPRVVLNQVGVPGRPEIPLKDFGAALGVHPCLVLPFDPKSFGAAANNGQMLLEANAKSKASEGFLTLAQIVSRRELPALPAPGKAGKTADKAKGGGSLLSKLFKR